MTSGIAAFRRPARMLNDTEAWALFITNHSCVHGVKEVLNPRRYLLVTSLAREKTGSRLLVLVGPHDRGGVH